ncbi:M48 family metalloprotease [Pontibacter chinhatensis]|uniref:Putative Zn-dependent protease n=1 Tax=Pontibacter chinhatensis TaxID=1436961 RepID=A0A1I2MA21_9BACT|nr:M48 family metalloprotease [Pontibacter chinhatensis]SFF87649.1 Putative Zn-dependent protease [Pontibacter chinhatensis]
MKKYMFSAAMAGVLLLFNFCATNPVTGKKDIVLMSEEQEIALGAQSDPAVLAQFGLYEDKALQQFIQQKGQAMAAVSHRPNLKYEFKVVDSPVINAFALPGGYVYFTRGIMAHFNNEAQFAGVLGHEIGHITARHSVQQQSKSTLAQLGLITGMIISPELAQMGNELSQGLGLLFLKFGRDDERESDELGVEYSSKIGYDASQMADFFQTLQRQQESSGQMIPDFLSTHPNPADRYATVHKLAEDWKKKENLTNAKVGRDSYLKLIDGIVYGEDPRQGFVENSVFYHPELKFKFPVPSGWAYQNSPQVFQMAPQDGSAMMNLMLVPGDNLEAAAQTLLKNFNLEPVESKSVTVNGLPAIAVVADQKQEQQVIRTLTYIIRYGNYNYSLMGITTANNFNNYFQTFSNTMQNFAELTEPDKLNRKPERIRIITVPQSATLSQVLQNNNIKQDRLEEFAVLNGMQLSDRVEKGTLLKVVSQ